MTATQRIALVEIADAAPLRLNDLAARMGTSAPTASRAVDVLDELGLVTRAPDPGDRRARADRADARRAPPDRRAQGARVARPSGRRSRALAPADRERLLTLLARMTDTLLHLGGPSRTRASAPTRGAVRRPA